MIYFIHGDEVPRVGPIWFDVAEARDFLVMKGMVSTLRPRKRTEGITIAMFHGKDGVVKIGRVVVRFIAEIDDPEEDLMELVPFSGFKSLEAWLKAAKGSRFLYLVFLIEPLDLKKRFEILSQGKGSRDLEILRKMIEEGNEKDFTHAGLPCHIHRTQQGFLCGYVGVPSSHPLYGVGLDILEEIPLDIVHGGVTWAGRAHWKEDEFWYFGFDCGHYGDYAPFFIANAPDAKYRDMEYVEKECRRLAELLSNVRWLGARLERESS